jgi:hypothetical protein
MNRAHRIPGTLFLQRVRIGFVSFSITSDSIGNDRWTTGNFNHPTLRVESDDDAIVRGKDQCPVQQPHTSANL